MTITALPKQTRSQQIIARVAAKHGIRPEDICSQSRQRAFAWPRHEAMYCLRHELRLSTPVIGRMLGGRDHSTVVVGVKRHTERLERELKIRGAHN